MSSKNQSYILKPITISNMVRYEIDRSVLFLYPIFDGIKLKTKNCAESVS